MCGVGIGVGVISSDFWKWSVWGAGGEGAGWRVRVTSSKEWGDEDEETGFCELHLDVWEGDRYWR